MNLLLQYGAYLGMPVWAICPDCAQMGPILTCILGHSPRGGSTHYVSVRRYVPVKGVLFSEYVCNGGMWGGGGVTCL